MVNETKFTCSLLRAIGSVCIILCIRTYFLALGHQPLKKLDMVRIKFSNHTYTLEIR